MTETPTPDTPRPQPVLVANLAAAGATLLTAFLLAWLASLGILLPDTASQALEATLTGVLVGLLGALYAWVAALFARRRVTPLDSPQTATGEALVPQSSKPPLNVGTATVVLNATDRTPQQIAEDTVTALTGSVTPPDDRPDHRADEADADSVTVDELRERP